MLRKIALGLIAATSLDPSPLPRPLPPAAFITTAIGAMVGVAGHGYGFGGIYINTGVSDCSEQQWVETRHGMRLRTVNVCAYMISPDQSRKSPDARRSGLFLRNLIR